MVVFFITYKKKWFTLNLDKEKNMNMDQFFPSASDLAQKTAGIPSPKRKLKIPEEDVIIINNAINELDESSLKTEDLYEIFYDWQTKKTLTLKRLFLSTSVLVASATWIDIDYTNLSIFGLEVAEGSPKNFIVFILTIIILSGLFFQISRWIDTSIRKSKVTYITSALSNLDKEYNNITRVMERNKIESFNELYYDFRSALNSPGHNAIDVFRAVKFYKKNLTKARAGLSFITVSEYSIIYGVALFAAIVLVKELIYMN